jgi:hypothetical protein
LFLDREYKPTCPFVKVHDLDAWRNRIDEVRKIASQGGSSVGEDQAIYRIQRAAIDEVVTIGDIPLAQLGGDDWNFGVGRLAKLMQKLQASPVKLGNIARLFVGIQTDGDAIFILHDATGGSKTTEAYSKALDSRVVVENTLLRRLLKGSVNLDRYEIRDDGKRLIFPYAPDSPNELVPMDQIERSQPNAAKYLRELERVLKKRGKGKLGNAWHGYVYKKNHGRLAGPKILCPAIARGAAFAYDSTGDFFFTGSGSGGGGAYGIRLNDDQKIASGWLLGVLNSKLADCFFKLNSTPFRGGWIALTKQHIEVLPIRPIDFTNPADVEKHDRMVSLVERMLELVPKRRAENNPQVAAQLDAQIAATDRQIDRLVYDLYGLTEEEIKLVEGA